MQRIFTVFASFLLVAFIVSASAAMPDFKKMVWCASGHVKCIGPRAQARVTNPQILHENYVETGPNRAYFGDD